MSIKVIVEDEEYLLKTVKPKGKISRVYVPKDYVDEYISVIPVNSDYIKNSDRFVINTNRIYRKKVSPSGNAGAIYLPIEEIGNEVLIIKG